MPFALASPWMMAAMKLSFSTRPDGVIDVDLGPGWAGLTETLLDAVSSRAPRGSDGQNPSTYWIDRCLTALDAAPGGAEALLLEGNATELWLIADLVVARSAYDTFDDEAVARSDFVAILGSWRREVEEATRA